MSETRLAVCVLCQGENTVTPYDPWKCVGCGATYRYNEGDELDLDEDDLKALRFFRQYKSPRAPVVAEASSATDAIEATEAEISAANCCHACFDASHVRLMRRRFIVCPTCGNKRCPKASNHTLECTHSNEPGQAGSVYS